MNTFVLFVAMLAPAIFVAAALAQTQVPPPAGRSSSPPGGTTPAPKRRTPVESRIEKVDPSRSWSRQLEPCSSPASSPRACLSWQATGRKTGRRSSRDSP